MPREFPISVKLVTRFFSELEQKTNWKHLVLDLTKSCRLMTMEQSSSKSDQSLTLATSEESNHSKADCPWSWGRMQHAKVQQLFGGLQKQPSSPGIQGNCQCFVQSWMSSMFKILINLTEESNCPSEGPHLGRWIPKWRTDCFMGLQETRIQLIQLSKDLARPQN